MILTLWLSLLALAFGLCVLSYYTDDEPYLTVGLTIIFLLGIAIVTNSLTYQSGDQKNVTFTYNGSLVTSQTEVTTYTYTTWNDTRTHIVGYLLAALGGVGVALSLRNTKNRGPKDGEDE